ncbi:hypothetical protein [uncultured Bacteroides sp.]|nr:hypothetical protein [uncultured Bacteroides sp.]
MKMRDLACRADRMGWKKAFLNGVPVCEIIPYCMAPPAVVQEMPGFL